MKRVYVAGAYSADNMADLLANMRRGIALALEVWKAGFAPFTPWLDLLLHLQPGADFAIEECYGMSLEWLKVSHAIIVVPQKAEQSTGLMQHELPLAEKLGIPVYWELADLILVEGGRLE